jgi:UDP-N-acetyl-D-mannosaminuronic acid transferase (WecB/TagA/CpsF family)
MDIYKNFTVEILDVPICGISLKEFLDIDIKAIINRKRTIFTAINTYSILMAQKKEFFNHFKTADFVLSAGIGMVWDALSIGGGNQAKVIKCGLMKNRYANMNGFLDTVAYDERKYSGI